jgi:hypothetical protein
MRIRPPLRTVGPEYVFVPVPKVAKPRPSLVNPPVPVTVAVMLSDPAAEDCEVWMTMPVTESLNTNGTENVLFPVPLPVVVIFTPAPPLFRMSLEPAVPVVKELAKLPAMSLLIEPTVKPAVPESVVTVRAAVALSKITAAPMAFGTVAGVQFAAVAQLPPAPRFQVCAGVEGEQQKTRAAALAASHLVRPDAEVASGKDRGAKTVRDEA